MKKRSEPRERTKILTVTIHDCVVRTSRSGGKGGQNVNKRETKVDVLHEPSGARGVSSEERSQLQNKKTAFRRMCETAEFTNWVRIQAGEDARMIAAVERELWPDRIKIETKNELGEWE